MFAHKRNALIPDLNLRKPCISASFLSVISAYETEESGRRPRCHKVYYLIFWPVTLSGQRYPSWSLGKAFIWDTLSVGAVYKKTTKYAMRQMACPSVSKPVPRAPYRRIRLFTALCLMKFRYDETLDLSPRFFPWFFRSFFPGFTDAMLIFLSFV